LYELCSSGKSGSLFYYTKDRNYLIKTMPLREFAKLRGILADYLEHLTTNPDSMIARFFGMYKLQWQDTKEKTLFSNTKQVTSYIVIMDNLFRSHDVGIRFDLKGSSIGRTRLKKQ
jgi:1-phosphatidylinositol-4-phosphate 5-kinase